MATSNPVAIFPFTLFPFSSSSTESIGQQQGQQQSTLGLFGQLPQNLQSMFPFLNFPMFANGQYPSFPITVPVNQQQAGSVPMGVPILPAFSALPEMLATTFDYMLAPMESSMQQAASSSASITQSAMSSVTSMLTSLRNSMKKSFLAPETAREQMSGQFTPALITPTYQQGYQEGQQQSQPALPGCTYQKQDASLCGTGTQQQSTTPPQVQ